MSFKGDELESISNDAANGVDAAVAILEKAPSLDTDDTLYWNSFHELSTCRLSAMSVGAIPLTAMMDYTTFYPFTEEEAHFFVSVIRHVDSAYLSIVHKKSATTSA